MSISPTAAALPALDLDQLPIRCEPAVPILFPPGTEVIKEPGGVGIGRCKLDQALSKSSVAARLPALHLARANVRQMRIARAPRRPIGVDLLPFPVCTGPEQAQSRWLIGAEDEAVSGRVYSGSLVSPASCHPVLERNHIVAWRLEGRQKYWDGPQG